MKKRSVSQLTRVSSVLHGRRFGLKSLCQHRLGQAPSCRDELHDLDEQLRAHRLSFITFVSKAQVSNNRVSNCEENSRPKLFNHNHKKSKNCCSIQIKHYVPSMFPNSSLRKYLLFVWALQTTARSIATNTKRL